MRVGNFDVTFGSGNKEKKKFNVREYARQRASVATVTHSGTAVYTGRSDANVELIEYADFGGWW